MNAAVECDPTAVVHDGAELGVGVKIRPYAVIRATARVGDRCEIGEFTVVDEHTTLGPDTRVFPHACVGSEPQDLKFSGERSYLETGARNVFREFVTVNRGTDGGGGVTRVGSDNMFMAYCHIAHDCEIGNHTIFGNAATLAGHVQIGDWAVLNAFCGVQQFVRIGAHAYLAAFAGADRDVVPYAKAHGNHCRVVGVNSIGLRRRGFTPESRRQLKQAYRVLFRDQLNTTQALEEIARRGFDAPEVAELVRFIQSSERGIVK